MVASGPETSEATFKKSSEHRYVHVFKLSIRKRPKSAFTVETFSVFPDNGLNPNNVEIGTQSRAWINQYGETICGPKMLALMDNCNLELINSYCYPYADRAGLRAAMDLTNIQWLYDEYTDTETGARATKAAKIVKRSLREQDFDDRSWICRMMKDFRQNHIEKAGPNVSRRFVNNFCSYVDLVGKEAWQRERDKVLDIPGYISFRRESGAVRTCFDMSEYCLGLDLPQFVHDDPVFVSGYNAALDLVCIANDLFSYNTEQAKGHGAPNFVTVIMKSKRVKIQAAVDFIGGYCEALTINLLEARRVLASRADRVFAKDAAAVLDGLGDWVRGNDQWSFVTEQYFGSENRLVKKTRVVEIRKKFEGVFVLSEIPNEGK